MPRHDFHDALSEAQEFIALARQYREDGDDQEAEANVVAAVATLERLLPDPERELG
jgi:hypothetical protein